MTWPLFFMGKTNIQVDDETHRILVLLKEIWHLQDFDAVVRKMADEHRKDLIQVLGVTVQVEEP